MFAVHDPAELKEAVASVDRELRHQYVIGYYPEPGRFDGGFHEIRLETKKRSRVVRTRSGYYGIP